jgi:hypothetical protein
MFERVAGRIALPDRVGLENLLDVVGPGPTTPYNRLKQPAGKASWSGFREQVEHLRWVDSLGDTGAWLEGIAESKIADFAGEAMAADAAAALRRARRIVEDAGGFDAQLAEIEAVSAHHANNYMPLVEKHRRRDRATMFAFTTVVELEATSADRSVLDAVDTSVRPKPPGVSVACPRTSSARPPPGTSRPGS